MKAEKVFSALSLFSSGGTLICCALPAALVSIGAGASLAGLISIFPQIVWFSEYKAFVFGTAGFLILVSAAFLWSQRHAACPIDQGQAKACKRLRSLSVVSLMVALTFYLTGVTFAFIIPWWRG